MKTELTGAPRDRFAPPPLPAGLRRGTAALLLCAAMSASAWAAEPVAARDVEVQGVKLHYLTSGHGAPLLLLHGYAETSLMWRPLMPCLAERLGHDIVLIVPYAYAAMCPAETTKLVVMDAFLPGVAGWEAVYNNPGIWHFRFNGPTPEALVRGRERIYFDYFWNAFAPDKPRPTPEADRKASAAAYARPGRMKAGWAYFVSFNQAAKDFAQLARTPLTMPVLSIGGEKSLGEVLGAQMKSVARDVTVIVLKNTGHWILEENTRETTDALTKFL